MRIPSNCIIHQSELATYWFDENGILHGFIKPITPTLEKIKENYSFIQKISNGRRAYFLSNSSSARLLDDESQAFIQEQLPKTFMAMAVVSETAMGKVNVTLYKNLQKPAIPICVFSDIKEAQNWLKAQMALDNAVPPVIQLKNMFPNQ